MSLPLAFVTLLLPAAKGFGQGPAAASGTFDERMSGLRAVVQRVVDLDSEAWKQPTFEKSAELMGQSAEVSRKTFGAQHWLTRLKQSLADGFVSLSKLPPTKAQLYNDSYRLQSTAAALLAKGDRVQGIGELRKAHQQRVAALGPTHTMLLYGLLSLTATELAIGEYEGAKAHAAETIGIAESVWGADNPGTVTALSYQGTAEIGLKEFDSAEKHLTQAIRLFEPVTIEGLSELYVKTHATSEIQLARLLNLRERFADAEPHAHRAVELLALMPRDNFGALIEAQIEVARSLSGQQNATGADILFRSITSSIDDRWPPRTIALVLAPYAEHLRRNNRTAEAGRVEARLKELSKEAGK